MWTNGDDLNDDGDRVRLYQPIAYSSGRGLSQDDLAVSYIGGASMNCGTKICDACEEPCDQLLQLHVPSRKETFHVLGCNRAKCVNGLFGAENALKSFSLGGGGVFYAERKEAKECPSAPAPAPAPAPVPVVKKEETTNDWTVDSDDDDDDLEQQVAAMELKAANKEEDGPKASNKNSAKKKKKENTSTTSNNLPCFELHSVLEPLAKHKQQTEEDEEDMIGAGSSGSDAKIQQMLAKYMAEEEDEEILAALRGTAMGGGGGSGGGKSREKDERLKASDRALLAFQDRIKRAPRQVVRYAPNGVPIWSIPKPQGPSSQKGKGKKSKVNFEEKEAATATMTIPPCSCGAEPRFEFQLMPSLLHVLEVDKHANDNNDNATDLGAIMSADYGGMNWGAIAVYSCPKENSCYVVVQASVDETPVKRVVADAPVFIKEDQKFDALANDGDELVGCNDDDDDDYSVASVAEADMVFTMDG